MGTILTEADFMPDNGSGSPTPAASNGGMILTEADFVPDSNGLAASAGSPQSWQDWGMQKAGDIGSGIWAGITGLPSAVNHVGNYLADVGDRTMQNGGPGMFGVNYLSTMAGDFYNQAENQSAPQTIAQAYGTTFGKIPIYGPVSTASIQSLADASDEYRGFAASTTGDEKLKKASQIATMVAAPNVVGSGLKAASNWLDDAAGASARKSLGARQGDYAKTANEIQIIEPIEGDVQTVTRKALDDLISSGKLGSSRDPVKLLTAANSEAEKLSTKIGEIVRSYDETGGKPVLPEFKNAMGELMEGKVPADKVNSYLNRLGELESEIASIGRGKLSFLQQQKIALGQMWSADDSILNNFNRAIYKDLQTAIESATPAVKPLNQELSRYKVAIPIFARNLAAKENMTPAQAALQTIRTSGGIGAPAILGGAVGGVPGAVVGTGLGLGLKAALSPQGLRQTAGAMSLGADLAGGAAMSTPIIPNAIAALLGGSQSDTNDPISAGPGSQDRREETPASNRSQQPDKSYSSLADSVAAMFGPSTAYASEVPTPSYAGGVPTSLSEAVQYVESRGNPSAESSKGAIGTHQVMPIAVRDVMRAQGVDDRQYTDADLRELLRQPGMSKAYGEAYLALLLERYDGNLELALAAYNGGPSRLDARGRNIAAMPLETQNYVPSVFAAMNRGRA